MSCESDKRIRRLEEIVRQQKAIIDRQSREITRLTEELKVARLELAEERQQHAETKRRLQELVHAVSNADERYQSVLRKEFGASSERLLGTQLSLAENMEGLDPDIQAMFDQLGKAQKSAQSQLNEDAEEIVNGGAAEGPDSDSGTDDVADDVSIQKPKEKKRKRPAGSGGRNPIPEGLKVNQIRYIATDDHPMLANVIEAKLIRQRIISRLGLAPLEVVRNDYCCDVYSLTLPGGIKTQQTIAPPAVMPKGQADDDLLIHTACDKVLDHLPSYRQAARFERIGFPINRSKLCRWHIILAAFLEPIANGIFDEILQESVVGIDDTVHRLIDAELHRCKQGRLWAATGEKNRYYQFSETREGKWVDDLLCGFAGGVMGDAYSGHNVLLSRDHITAIFCWAHVRRKFFESAEGKKRDQALFLIGKLYDIEKEIEEKPPTERVAIRTQMANPILAQFKQLLDAWEADKKVLPQSGIGRATTYALNQWPGLTTYVSIGESPIDNNRTERAMRPNALHRKNSLFSASTKGAEAYATLSTVIHTACEYDLNPATYLADVINDMHLQRRDPSQLTPMAYAARLRAGGMGVKGPC